MQQRVIFYLVAIPTSLQPLLLSEQNDNDNRDNKTSISTTVTNKDQDETYKQNIISKSKLIPLFMSTLPRHDCLQVIYTYVIKYRERYHCSKTSNNDSKSKFTPKIIIDEYLKSSSSTSTSQMSNNNMNYLNCKTTSIINNKHCR